MEVSVDAASPSAPGNNEPSPVSMLGSTPSSGRPPSTSRFQSANEDTGFESASSAGHQILSDDERGVPSTDICKTSLNPGASESETSYSTSSLRPLQKPPKRGEVADEHLSTPITPIAEDHGSVGNDGGDERQLSESTSSGEHRHCQGSAANFPHARRAYLNEAALRASLREALAKGHGRSDSPASPQPADIWMSQAGLPAQAREHVQLFDTGYLNTDGSASEGDAEAYESESESEADELDELAQQLQVRGSLNLGTTEAEQCAICMEHDMEAAMQDCSHEVCLKCAYQLCARGLTAPLCPFCRGPIKDFSSVQPQSCQPPPS
ncbi:hypothetical protein WJX84_007083 [Apatococcus fuscideae]